MEIIEVSNIEYATIIKNPFHIFGSAEFNNLNSDKCESVHYLLFKENKYRLGIIGGIKNRIFLTPFSAPFGGFIYLSEDIRLQYIEQALDQLKSWASEKDLVSINITLPPSIYNKSFIAKQINCLFRKEYEITKIDLNYSFDLTYFDEKYTDRIWYNARKNLRIAQNAGLCFAKCVTDDEKRQAYDIIRKNREARGFPLRMKWQEVVNTIQIIPADFFMMYDYHQIPIASAIVFQVNHFIVQVIYWGDLPEFAEFKTMNFLSYKVFEYYKSLGYKIVDIGPSTENSIPNYGLCEFKESLGCDISPKLIFHKILNR